MSPNEMSVGHYFAVPRLFARLRGGSAARSEQNWTEAAIAGTLVHAITFLFAARVLLTGRSTSQQLLLLIPLVLLVWMWWPILIYANALIIKAARAAGLLRDAADRHIQSVLIATVTTLFAVQLIAAGSWMRALGFVWIAAVILNLAAAAVLALIDAEPAR